MQLAVRRPFDPQRVDDEPRDISVSLQIGEDAREARLEHLERRVRVLRPADGGHQLVQHAAHGLLGGIGIAVLMGAAVLTHLRVKNPAFKMLPSLTLWVLPAAIIWLNYRMLAD